MNKMKTGFCFLLLCLGAGLQANAIQTSTDCPVAQLSVCPATLDTQLPNVKDMLIWGLRCGRGRQRVVSRVIGFCSDYRSYPRDVFKAGEAVPIPRDNKDLSAVSYQYQGQNYPLADYLKRNSVTGMMVIKEGKIVWDYYGSGNTNTTLWTSRSVGKSAISTLGGVALKEGKIASLDDEIVKYNPDVCGTAWEHVTARQLM